MPNRKEKKTMDKSIKIDIEGFIYALLALSFPLAYCARFGADAQGWAIVSACAGISTIIAYTALTKSKASSR